MALPKDLIQTMRARRTVKRLAEDPDTLHGLLMLIEQRAAQPSRLAEFFGLEGSHLTALLTAARNGSIGRQRAGEEDRYRRTRDTVGAPE